MYWTQLIQFLYYVQLTARPFDYPSLRLSHRLSHRLLNRYNEKIQWDENGKHNRREQKAENSIHLVRVR